ncbi:PREDICTED: cation channel sperm-associated protein subunit gamma 1-like [Priapulus caudatus]|uniref:Cation channel sperm-associated protein subunit gamma 1-like n=1 Tax=Priapulus caudatus TaxID=37621 RepID=A0ABM1F9A4_PRICU|nr:PREDICTED: cation channel sperm-associated protein subunit gamma 1-like [Priapulus caudatus]
MQTPMQMVSAMFIVSDTSLLEVSATREDLYVRLAVLYRVSIRDKGLRRSQALPGSELHPVSLRIQVSNSVGCCFTSSQDERLFMGMQHTTVMLGCPPGQKLMFDVDASLAVTKPYDCLVPIENMPCFYYAEGFYPRFVIMDRIQRTYHNFTGSYILTVVGGGSGGESNVRLYTDEEIQTYNNQDSSDATLIWGPLAEDMDRAVPVFNQKSNGISWLCQKKSPCANIAPKFPASPEYFFLINVTNRDVDINSTNCIYTTQFLIRIHGLPMDSIKGSLFITCFTIFLICLFIVIYGICKRNDEKIYKRFKDSVYDRIYMKLKPVKKLNSTEIAVQVLKKQAAAARQQRFMIQQQGQWSWTKAMPELGELDEMSESENEGSSDSSGIILPASTVNPTESSDAVLPAVDLPKQ